VVYRPVADKAPPNSIVAVTPAGQKLSRRVTAAIEVLQATETNRREDLA
jgi:hypothetical protein